MEDLSNVSGENNPIALRKELVQKALDLLAAASSISRTFRVDRMTRDGEYDMMLMKREINKDDGQEPQGE